MSKDFNYFFQRRAYNPIQKNTKQNTAHYRSGAEMIFAFLPRCTEIKGQKKSEGDVEKVAIKTKLSTLEYLGCGQL